MPSCIRAPHRRRRRCGGSGPFSPAAPARARTTPRGRSARRADRLDDRRGDQERPPPRAVPGGRRPRHDALDLGAEDPARAVGSNASHAAARSVAGSPAVMSPKSMTATRSPRRTARAAGWPDAGRRAATARAGPRGRRGRASQTMDEAAHPGTRPPASRARRPRRGAAAERRGTRWPGHPRERASPPVATKAARASTATPRVSHRTEPGRAVEPRHDAPRHVVAEPGAGPTVPHRGRHRDGQARGELGQPPLLVRTSPTARGAAASAPSTGRRGGRSRCPTRSRRAARARRRSGCCAATSRAASASSTWKSAGGASVISTLLDADRPAVAQGAGFPAVPGADLVQNGSHDASGTRGGRRAALPGPSCAPATSAGRRWPRSCCAPRRTRGARGSHRDRVGRDRATGTWASGRPAHHRGARPRRLRRAAPPRAPVRRGRLPGLDLVVAFDRGQSRILRN